MSDSLFYSMNSVVLASVLFIGILLFYFFGIKAAGIKKEKNPEFTSSGMGPFEGAMLGLLSLLLAFTFNQSASYYNNRRELLMHETNCIGTVLLRSDLYPDSVRIAFRKDIREYILNRIHYYEAAKDESEIQNSVKAANKISARIWDRAAIISQQNESTVKSMQMIPAINDMIDALGSREEARKAHVPDSIMWLLFILCISGSFIVGYSGKSKKPDWVILFSYSLMTVMTIYLILDLDQPRTGIINTNNTHQNMVDLLSGF